MGLEQVFWERLEFRGREAQVGGDTDVYYAIVRVLGVMNIALN